MASQNVLITHQLRHKNSLLKEQIFTTNVSTCFIFQQQGLGLLVLTGLFQTKAELIGNCQGKQQKLIELGGGGSFGHPFLGTSLDIANFRFCPSEQ